MNLFLNIAIHTANILGIFTDPFEFAGDYGSEINPTRDKVFELVMSKEALAKNLKEFEIEELLEKSFDSSLSKKEYKKLLIEKTKEEDKKYGPTLSELIPSSLVESLQKKQKELEKVGFTEKSLEDFITFLNTYKNQKIFYFFRNTPPNFLSLDKAIKDKEAQRGDSLEVPILSSINPLKGKNGLELKENLLQKLFTKEILSLTKPPEILQKTLLSLENTFFTEAFGKAGDNRDLEVFTSPSGQTLLYFLYQSLNLHLIAADSTLIPEINTVKKIFSETIGDPRKRALIFKEKLLKAHSEVLFTQECNLITSDLLTKEGPFLPLSSQNPLDGTFVFLHKDNWESFYEVISIDNYEGFKEGKINLILATQKETNQKFLLGSCHGHSTKAEDGRLQVQIIKEKFDELEKKPENKNLQLLIGIDANTKTEEEVEAFRTHLKDLGLISTNVGPTTIKRRMLTVQNAKSGKWSVDEEDYLISLDSSKKGIFSFNSPTVGFKQEKPNIEEPLPNKNNLSDHYPVGVTLEYLSNTH